MNLPNLLAFARILIAPVIFMLLVNRNLFPNIHPSWLDYFAGLLFVIAGITDFLDGYIARKWNQITKLGSILDPLADKMLTLAGFIGLMMLHRADEWAIFLILTREFFITGLRVVAVSEGRDVSATLSGKIKTVVQLIAIGFLIMDWYFGSFLLWISVILTIYSGYEYVRDYWRNSKC